MAINYKTYKDTGAPIKRKSYGQNWGPEVRNFHNMITYLKNRSGLVDKDIVLAFCHITDPEFWVTAPPWKHRIGRFYLEHALSWLKVYKLLDNCHSREEFFEKIGLDEEEAVELIPTKIPSRLHFPAIAEKLGKEEQYNKLKLT